MSIRQRNQSRIERISINRIIVLVFIIITIYPIIFVLLTAFKSTDEFYVNIWLLPKKIMWSNFPKAWIEANIGNYFVNSIIVVAITVFSIIVIASLAGYALSKLNVPHANLILFIIVSATMLPSEGIIMALYLMMSKLNMIGNYLSLIIPYTGWGIPIATYLFTNFFSTIPSELLESARVDGCKEIKLFVKIIIPLMLPAVATVAIFNFVTWWGELLWATITLSSTSLKTIPLGIISFRSQYDTDWGPLSAAIIMVLIPLVAFFLFTQKYYIKGITGGAIK